MGHREFVDPESKYLEDFEVGDRIVTRGRTVDASDISGFSGMTGDFYPIHVDEEYCRRATRFKTRIAHGPLIFGIAAGLVGMTGYYGDAIVALVEIRSMKALKPVVAGDTLHVVAEVTTIETDRSPRKGLLEVLYSVVNQRDEEVFRYEQVMLATRRPSDDMAKAAGA